MHCAQSLFFFQKSALRPTAAAAAAPGPVIAWIPSTAAEREGQRGGAEDELSKLERLRGGEGEMPCLGRDVLASLCLFVANARNADPSGMCASPINIEDVHVHARARRCLYELAHVIIALV